MARRPPNRYKKTVAGLKAFTALCAYYAYCCIRCGRRSGKLTQDHIDPAGPDDIVNLQPLCGACNNYKGSRFIDYRCKPHPNTGQPPQRWTPAVQAAIARHDNKTTQ